MAADEAGRRERRVAMFRQVAAERIAKLSLLWIEVERRAGDPGVFLREAHTLKGEASLTGFMLVARLVHAVEDYVKVVRERGRLPAEGDGDVILSGLDLTLRLTLGAPDAASREADAFLAQVASARGGPLATAPPPVAQSLSPPSAPALAEPAPEALASEGWSGGSAAGPGSARAESSIRVTPEKIDHLRGMVSDLLLAHVRWRQLARTARRLRESSETMRPSRQPGEGTEVSGRGIGLNIVLDVVGNVGGKVDVRSERGRGTTFDIEVPLTVAITRVVLFRVGMGNYALSAASVRSLVEAQTMQHRDGPDGPAVEYAGTAVPLLDLGEVLDEPDMAGARARIVIAQSGADLVALSGTEGHLEREVMLKPMGKFFEKLPLVPAAVNLEEGALALVLKAAELVLLARAPSRTRMSSAGEKGRGAAGRIALVADDSPVVRDIIAQALRAHGLHVLTAGDGEEALAVFGASARVDIVVTDIDMPRLDGLALVRALRGRASSKDIPVVAISMRGGEPERRPPWRRVCRRSSTRAISVRPCSGKPSARSSRAREEWGLAVGVISS